MYNHYNTNNTDLVSGIIGCKNFRIGFGAMEDRWLSVEQISQYLGVSKDSVYAWRVSKNLPAHKIGRLWKFKVSEVDSWVRSGQAAEDSQAEDDDQ